MIGVAQALPDARPHERALLTVMVTDIVGSTARAVAVGDLRWRRLIVRHDEIARTTVAEFGGSYVKSLGDGLLATFDSATAAISCARTLIAALDALDLPLRTGLHTGEVELVGADILGITVNVAGRMCALAGGGEIIVSRAVRERADECDATFSARGTRRLKGLPNPWPVYALD